MYSGFLFVSKISILDVLLVCIGVRYVLGAVVLYSSH